MENALQSNKPARTELIDWIGAWICRELKLEPAQLEPEATFVRYGMDSVHAIMLIGDLEERLGCRLSPTLAWDHPTIEALAGYLAQETVPTGSPAQSTDKEALLARIEELTEEELDALLKAHQAVAKRL